jgi:hypothetical protein
MNNLFHQNTIVSTKNSQNEISNSFLSQQRQKSPKTGKIPMYVRLTLDRKKAEMRLNIEMSDVELKNEMKSHAIQ